MMKKASLFILALAVASVCGAKDIKTVVLNTNPEMHCSGCENKIKSNIRYEKGVKTIETNLEDKTVTIEYDADKTSVEKIIEGFKKIKYEATVASPKAKGCSCGKKTESGEKAETSGEKKGGCCGGNCKCGSKEK
jgi:copper chaperone CopZ